MLLALVVLLMSHCRWQLCYFGWYEILSVLVSSSMIGVDSLVVPLWAALAVGEVGSWAYSKVASVVWRSR